MKPTVSVIIPVFNTEKYLAEALGSVLGQSLENVELITVDDGSTDGSLDLLKSYGDKLTVISQPNSGQGTARNKALSIARGEYVYFMDSDDWIDADTLEKAVECCRENELDFVFFDAESFGAESSDKPWFNYHRSSAYTLPEKGSTVLKDMLSKGIYRCSVCMCLYRRDFLQENNILFPEGILHEDEYFSAATFSRAQRVAGIPKAFYHRRLREKSVMSKSFGDRNVEGYLRTLKLCEALKDSADSRAAIEALQGTIEKALLHNSGQLALKSRLNLLWSLLFKTWRR